MLLSQYLLLVRNLIQSPTSPVPLVPDPLLALYINLGRKQVALDVECVRNQGTVGVAAGNQVVPVTALATAQGGVDQALVVRNAWLDNQRVDLRPWDWFHAYYFNGPPNPPVLPESVMAHQGVGSFSTLYIYAQRAGTLSADVVFLPTDLIDDATFDAIPYPWVDAVSFYASWYAYMSMQRQADANTFLTRYNEMARRGRTQVTSTALPENDPGGLGAMVATTRTPLAAPAPQQQGGR